MLIRESITSRLRKGVGDIMVVFSLFLFGGYIMTEDEPSPLAPFVGQWTAHLTTDSGDAVIRWTLTTNFLGRGLQSSMVYESGGVVSHEINAIWFYSPESDSLIVQQIDSRGFASTFLGRIWSNGQIVLTRQSRPGEANQRIAIALLSPTRLSYQTEIGQVDPPIVRLLIFEK